MHFYDLYMNEKKRAFMYDDRYSACVHGSIIFILSFLIGEKVLLVNK